MYSVLIPSLVAARRNTCPCGAANNEPYGYCPKCVARYMWRRHHRRQVRRHRRTVRLPRRATRLVWLSFLLPQSGRGGDQA